MLKQTGCECSETKQVRYRWRLTVQSPGGTPDAGGHVDLTDDANWTTMGTIKANFITRGSREGRVFDQVQAEVSHIVETRSSRFSRSIHPMWRLVFQGRKFNIVAAVDKNEERQVVQIHLTEVI